MTSSGGCIGYSLRLADSEVWDITACEEARPWLEKLASILELRIGVSSDKKKLIFVRDHFKVPAANWGIASGGLFPENGWQIEHLGPIDLLSRTEDPSLICDLGKEGDEELEINKMWQALYPLYIHAIGSGGLPMHAALVERNGKGYAIAAPGGTGKSTCSIRIPPPWRALCDDEMLVVRDVAGTYHAHPLPTWKEYLQHRSNRTWDVQYHVPLAGLFFLLKSEDDDTEAIGRGKGATFIYRSASQVLYKSMLTMNPNNRQAVRLEIFQNSCKMVESVPTFFLRASLTGRFWEKMDEALKVG
jgi:SynChlorMet cassette protein ScmC